MTPEEVVIYAMMRGKRQFVRDVTEMGYSIRALGLESETVGRSFERVAHRGFLMNQALFTIRRFSYMGTLALTGAGAAAIKWGFDYNNAIQTAQVALQKFFHAVPDQGHDYCVPGAVSGLPFPRHLGE
jgi:hypothetical protein